MISGMGGVCGGVYQTLGLPGEDQIKVQGKYDLSQVWVGCVGGGYQTLGLPGEDQIKVQGKYDLSHVSLLLRYTLMYQHQCYH